MGLGGAGEGGRQDKQRKPQMQQKINMMLAMTMDFIVSVGDVRRGKSKTKFK
jgi:hypothetical protein